MAVPFSESMDSPEKNIARQQIINFIDENPLEVNRIFTLPSKNAKCAELFHSYFPNAHITGLEKGRSIVLNSYKCKQVPNGDPVKVKDELLDVLYCGSVSDMVGGREMSSRVWKPTKEIDQGTRPVLVKNKLSLSIKPFDLIFLDYTAFPSPGYISEVKDFVEKFANPNAIVAVTFCLNREDIDIGLLFPNYLIHRYSNANSKMCIIIWKHV
jgi:hypothetical protein